MESAKKFIRTEIIRVENSFIESSKSLSMLELELSKLSIPSQSFSQDQSGIVGKETKQFIDIQEKSADLRQKISYTKAETQYLNIYHTNLLNLMVILNQVVNKEKTNDENVDSGFEKVSLVINAQEEERYRLSRQIHDGPAQALANFILKAEIADRLMDIDIERARAELRGLKETATKTLKEVRNNIFELRPMMLDDLGLYPTIQKYIETQNEQKSIPILCEVTGGSVRLERTIEVMIFRALQELLANAMNHTGANAIKVKLVISKEMVHLEVSDDAKGIQPMQVATDRNFGLNLLRNRVLEFGGKFNLKSDENYGTVYLLSIPVNIDKIS